MSTTNSTIHPQQRLSRSNSTSSSMTARKSSALSPKAASRPAYLRGRSASPDSITRVLHSLNSSRTDIPRSDIGERRSGTGYNVNRWSHSTSSSISGIDADLIRKRTSSSGAVRRSVAGYNSLNENTNAAHKPTSYGATSPRRKSTKRTSAVAAPSVDGSRLTFQDSSNLNIVRDLTQNSTLASSEFFGSAWEHRTGLTKLGDTISGLSFQYTPDPTSAIQSTAHSPSYQENRTSPTRMGHRDRSTNKSKDQSKASVSSDKSSASRNKGHRSPKQKDMLSKALAKANSAVLLDNAQDIEGAIEAYNEACVLLEQVMTRSADIEDRRKLSAIRATYSDRIAELHDQNQTFADLLDKDLPQEPPLDDYEMPEDYYHDDASVHSKPTKEVPAINLPLRQESLLPQIFGGDVYLHDRSLPSVKEPIRSSQLHAPMDAQYMPSPLTPRHASPALPGDTLAESMGQAPHEMFRPTGLEVMAGGTSWLDNFDANSSRASSRLSNDFGPSQGQLVSDIEAEFDAAMNAAIETAYEDHGSQEPTPRTDGKTLDFGHGATPHALSNSSPSRNRFNPLTNTYLDDDAEDEERLLEQVSREFGLDTSSFERRNHQSIPRQSDSSGSSSRTWGSSVASTTATSGTALSTLAEAHEPIAPPVESIQSAAAAQKLQQAHPETQQSRPPSTGEKLIPIRDRRLSGQSAKQLKIETFSRRASLSQKHVLPPPPQSRGDTKERSQPEEVAASFSSTLSGRSLTPMTSTQSNLSAYEDSPITPALTSDDNQRDIGDSLPSPPRPTRMPPPPLPAIRQIASSSNLQKTNLTINTQPDLADSPGTPGSAIFGLDMKRQMSNSTPAVLTPGSNVLTSGYGGGLYLFEDQVGSSRSVRSPLESDPIPLEPCPEAYLLRPFWLMRSLSSALSHPHGGYVTQRLFIPRDIWRVRNVKIKAIEDKIATCDGLSVALQKLSKVDTLDASAVLEEMQAFEAILDQARSVLSKKLGSDVGLAGTKTVFSNSPATEDPEGNVPRSGNPSSAAKTIASGWRKLRSKSSSANLNSAGSSREVPSQTFTMPSLPMTPSSSVSTSRSYLIRSGQQPLTPSQLSGIIAPHAAYLTSLARLFESVSVLDSIARQVEDPGLKHSSQTHVGLELCVRNAAEFFGFYVIRFVMSDLLLLVDKFLKRGSEWVMT